MGRICSRRQKAAAPINRYTIFLLFPLSSKFLLLKTVRYNNMIMIVPKIACLAPLVSTNCKAIKEYMMILGFVFLVWPNTCLFRKVCSSPQPGSLQISCTNHHSSFLTTIPHLFCATHNRKNYSAVSQASSYCELK